MKPEYLLEDGEREPFFRDAGLRMGLHPVLVEKDYWVCWMLQTLFGHAEISNHLVFKGGTSLSKVFGIIHRFSEDIDLGLTPAYVGISEDIVESAESRNQRVQWMARMQEKCGETIQSRVMDGLESAVRDSLGPKPDGKTWLEYQMDKDTHSPVVLFHYPGSGMPGMEYIQQSVKLEFGTLTDQIPVGSHPVEPWVAQIHPGLFRNWKCEVIALEVERTFWEKATILHAAFHRPAEKSMRDRYARHYSDFAALWQHPSRDACLARLDLLERVSRHKTRYFGNAWTNYENARPGHLRLVPPGFRVDELARDYEKMQVMFTKAPPPLESILSTLAEAEARINAS